VKNSKPTELVLLLIVSIALWWRPLIASFRLALSSDAYTYVLLILPVVIALVFLEIKSLPAAGKSKRWVGTVLLSTALSLRAFTAWNPWHLSWSGNLSVSMFAVVIWWIGSVVLCFELGTVRSLLFPLCFLFLIVPMPAQAVDWVTEVLQQQSASAASMLFHLLGVPVARDGVTLSIPGLTIEVAYECSSIRSSTMLIVMTLILAHLFVRSGWRKIVLVLAAIPLSILKNAIRIVAIAELGTRVNPSFLHGRLHHHGGVVFLSMAVFIVLVLLWVLRRSENGASSSEFGT